MTKKLDAKRNMLEHSQAKVELYGRYLSIYLNILHRVKFIEKIFIFDLLCGEGIYENDAKGSPIITLETIKNHYFSNNKTCPNISIWFNDIGISELEPGIYKVDRVKRLSQEIFIPNNVTASYTKSDFREIFPLALRELGKTDIRKGLFFLDQYGYSIVHPTHIKEILENGNTEVILFLPASQMYRFADTATKSSFPGSEPLANFLREIFGNDEPVGFKNIYEFIERLKVQFRNYLQAQGIFVDTFTIERDSQNVYCLYFFTGNLLGFQKMLEAKWDLDTSQGRGFKLEKTKPLFAGIQASDYASKLYEFMEASTYRTNHEIFEFGLHNGHLPKHSNEIINQWKKELPGFEVFSLDGKPARGNYLEYDHPRSIGFRISVEKHRVSQKRLFEAKEPYHE